MSWHLQRLAAFDLETTGVDCEADRIVTASVCLVSGDQEVDSTNWLVDPGIEIPAQATAVHGITTEHVRSNGRPAKEAVEEITARLAEGLLAAVPIVAFNARYDLTMLDREARRYGLEPLEARVGGPEKMLVVDPHVLDKQFDRFRKGKRTLEAVCKHYGTPLEDAHSASGDAIAAARVAWRLATTYEELAALDLPALHAQQIVWADEQAASLEDYFRSQGRNEKVERAWPTVPSVAAAEIA